MIVEDLRLTLRGSAARRRVPVNNNLYVRVIRQVTLLVQIKFTLEQAMTAQRRGRGIPLPFT
jgi:hypothetical protein